MASAIHDVLWEGVTLPPWDPTELYALYQTLHGRSDGSARDQDRFVRLLMHVVGFKFEGKSKWLRRLPESGIEPQDLAEEVLSHIRRKVAEGKYAFDKPCEKVLLKALYSTIERFCTTKVRSARAKARRTPVNASELRGDDSGTDLSADAIDGSFAGTLSWDVSRVWRALRDAEDRVIHDVFDPARRGNLRAVRLTYRYLAYRLLHRDDRDPETLPPGLAATGFVRHQDLPTAKQPDLFRRSYRRTNIREGIIREQYNLLVFRIYGVVRECSAIE